MHVPFKTCFFFFTSFERDLKLLAWEMSYCFQLIGYTVGESPRDFDWLLGVVFLRKPS